MIVGNKHTIFADIPPNWIQAQNDKLPFFIKPNEKDVSSQTYIYIYGIDYNFNPDLNGWTDSNTRDIIDNFTDVKVDSINLLFKNLNKDNYLTGRYKVMTYEYKGKRKEALLIIECQNTIATVVLSAKDNSEFERLLSAFISIANSFKILGSTLKVE